MDKLRVDLDLLGLLEHQLHQTQQNAIQAELNAAGLQEVGHPLLLCILRSAGGDNCPDGQVQAQRELAQLLNVSPAAVSTSLKSLERKGYILREPGKKDARRSQVRLTEKGRQTVDACYVCIQSVSQRTFTGFSPEERTVLRDFYRRMLDNLRTPRPEALETP